MKQFLYKFKKEYEIKDPEILSRFPKKELKSFIKVECPVNTNDENLKPQEVQISLKRLRALNGVKEELVCQNCSKRDTCKVVNFVPELNEHSAKTGLSDLLTSLYYYAAEIEAQELNKINKEQANIEEEIIQVKSGKDKKKNDKEKADISVQKYRECQDQSTNFKNSTSANKLTDTMHQVLDDIYNNLGIETKKFNNEFIEEERNRRFMERIFKKLEKEISHDNKLRKQDFQEKFGISNHDQNEVEEEDNEYDQTPFAKKNQKNNRKQNIAEEEDEQENNEEEEEDDDTNFVQVAGNKKQKSLLDKIMNSNTEEGKQFNEAKKQYRNKNDESDDDDVRQIFPKKFEKNTNKYDQQQQFNKNNNKSFDRDNKQSFDRQKSYNKDSKQSFDRQPYNKDNKKSFDRESYNKDSKQSFDRQSYSKDTKQYQDRDSQSKFNKDYKQQTNKYSKERNFDDKWQSKGRSEERTEKRGFQKDRNDQDRWQSKSRSEERTGKREFQKDGNTNDRWQSKGRSEERFEKSGYQKDRNDQDRYQSKGRREDRDGKKYDSQNYEQNKYGKQQNNQREKSVDQKDELKQTKISFDRLHKIDDNNFSKFMYKDSSEQKAKIQQDYVQKHQMREQQKAYKFEQEVQKVQDIVQQNDDMLVREVDRKKQPKYSRGSFKFSKTQKND